MKNALLFGFFIGAARPPEINKYGSVGRSATKGIPTNASFVCSARPPFEQISLNAWWTCAMKNLFLFAFFIGSARPPEINKYGSVGRSATKEIPTNASFVGSACPLLLKHNTT